MSPARPKPEEILRHDLRDDTEEVWVPFHDDTEEPFSPVSPGESYVALVKREPIKSRSGKKGKRSLEDMIASMPNDVAAAQYGMERIAAAEDVIAKVLELLPKDARELVLTRRPALKKYAPEE